MRPERERQGGTWTDPRRARTTVRFLDAKDVEDDADPERGQWLPGLRVTPVGEDLLCHGAMGLAVAEGEELCRTIQALEEGHDQQAHEGARAACIEAGAYVARAAALSSERARAWAELRVSPVRAEKTLSQSGAWRHVELGTGPEEHAEFAQALERELNRLGFHRARGNAHAWPILWIDRRTQEAIAQEAERLLAERAQGARPWAMVFPGWMGWVAIGAGALGRRERGPSVPGVRSLGARGRAPGKKC